MLGLFHQWLTGDMRIDFFKDVTHGTQKKKEKVIIGAALPS